MVQDVLKVRWTSENAMSRQAESLGLTPSSRERLGLPRDSSGRRTIRVGGTEPEFIAALKKARSYIDLDSPQYDEEEPKPPPRKKAPLVFPLPRKQEEKKE